MENQNEKFAHVFFVDIISLSDKKLGGMDSQTSKINVLTRIITKSRILKTAKAPTISTAGDGLAVCFFETPKWPFQLAVELNKKLRSYNKKRERKKKIFVRIGIASGSIIEAKRVKNERNFWGLGLVYAQRIMSFGDADHILMDFTSARDLMGLSDSYKKIIHYLGKGKIKHEEEIDVYSVYGKGFGNKKTPEKLAKSIATDANYGRTILEAINAKQDLILQKLENKVSKQQKTKLQIGKKRRVIKNE